MPTRSPSAWAGSWWRQLGSGHTNTRFRGAPPPAPPPVPLLLLASAAPPPPPAAAAGGGGARFTSRHGTLWRRRCICRFCSRWNPCPQISHTYLSDSSSVRGDSATTSASGSGVPGGRLLRLAGDGCCSVRQEEEGGGGGGCRCWDAEGDDEEVEEETNIWWWLLTSSAMSLLLLRESWPSKQLS
uniref:Uncharacterized protein n=1 Tax=Zea mays TaxID=4577 RepID=C4J8L8_MAIZE|nr:unknown [Zea mays]